MTDIDKAIRHFECVRDGAIVVLDSGFGSHPGESDIVYRNRKLYAELAIAALREKQERSEMCESCSGIVYRQTKSGKIIPADKQCTEKITPPCYQPDGDDWQESARCVGELETENERLKKELEWKDKVIELAQRKQAEAEAENARLTADIDILMYAVEGDCAYCKHNGERGDQSPCWHCAGYAAREFVTGNYWEWMGVGG